MLSIVPDPIEEYRFIHHFVPHEEHKTRASLLSVKALFLYSIILVGLLGVFRLTSLVRPGVLGYASNIGTYELFMETNKARERHGLPALKLNSSLTRAAEKKANHMFAFDYWAHISPSGVKPWDFIREESYEYEYAGENLAKNFNNSEDVVQAWLNSPSHRENLLSPNYSEIGFAVKDGILDGYETTLVVQFFGSPQGYVASTQSSSPKTVKTAEIPVQVPLVSEKNVAPSREVAYTINMPDVSKAILVLLGAFLVSLLALDIWYSRKKRISKYTGHALAHLTFLLIALLSVWFVLSPGSIL